MQNKVIWKHVFVNELSELTNKTIITHVKSKIVITPLIIERY